jgi:N-acetylmuramoyl-L-alanine amidase
MRVFLISLLLFGSSASVFPAYEQQLIPIVREIRTSTAPSLNQWNTFVRTTDYGGTRYVALVQVAELLNGHLRWYPVSRNVDLSVHNQTIRFPYNASWAWINGRRQNLERPSVKNEDGFWVPLSFFSSPGFFRATRTKFEWPPKPVVVSPPPSWGRTKVGGQIPEAKLNPPSQPSPTRGEGVPVDAVRAAHAIHRIIIDPGHGGKDPGTVGSHGIEEKTINLQVAQALAEVLRNDYHYEVLLTRMDDTFVPLEERSRIANAQNADLFISIHCNASLSAKLKGFEVYFVSEKASDPHADAVARFENASLVLEGKPVPTPRQVAAVLRSLVKTANLNESSALGSLIDKHLGTQLLEPSLGVKQAAFYVLRGAEMPAILIETGFLSNAEEEKLLQNDTFRQKLIGGIAAGVEAYDERKQKERR